MKRLKFLLIILIIISFGIISSCGDSFTPFKDIPDADLGDDYFEHLIEKYSQFRNIYSYLMIEYLKQFTQDEILSEGLQAQTFDFQEASYKYWQEKHPDYLATAESYMPLLEEMTNRITGKNFDTHMGNMKHVIDSYVSALYITDYVPAIPVETQPKTNKEGEIVEQTTLYYVPVDLDVARESIAEYVSSEFLAKNPQKAVADYLKEHDIHVTRIEFETMFKNFEHHVYPFRVDYKYKIYYYTGDVPVEDEKKWKKADVRLLYYIGLDEEHKYIIKYISDPSVIIETEDPDEPKFEDFTTSEAK